MIILITNRNLHVDVLDEPVTVNASKIGKHIGNDGIYCADVVNHDFNSITIYPKGQEKDLFDSVSAEDMRKPWVFFTHGNNQNVRSNIEKCRAIHDHHGANVIAFSWPSQPYLEQDAFLKLMKKTAKKAAGYLFKLPVSLASLGSDAAMYALDHYENYQQARKNAVDSADELNEALQLAHRLLLRRIPGNVSKVLLTHSLGHLVLQTFVENGYSLPARFDNVILHQADADADDHHRWVPALTGKAGNLYITTNQYDFVLATSRLSNGEERLGQTKDFTVRSRVKYVDFSDGGWVDEEHNFFIHEQGEPNDEIFTFMHRVLRGRADGLPTKPFTSKSGFSRTTRNGQVYRLQYILDPTGDGDANDPDQYMQSL